MSKLVYAGVAEGDRAGGYSLFFPDLPGCVTAADTMAELVSNGREALSLHLEGMAEDGVPPPVPTDVEKLPRDAEAPAAAVVLVDVSLDDEPVRVNVSLPSALLERIDAAAKSRGLTRSGFLAEGAKKLLKTG
jgi:predicted RNase H-like HicB family nuclease